MDGGCWWVLRVTSWAHSPVEGLLVLFNFAPAELVELGVNVYELVLFFDFLALLEVLVDLLPPVEEITELRVGRHGFYLGKNKKKKKEDKLKPRSRRLL